MICEDGRWLASKSIFVFCFFFQVFFFKVVNWKTGIIGQLLPSVNKHKAFVMLLSSQEFTMITGDPFGQLVTLFWTNIWPQFVFSLDVELSHQIPKPVKNYEVFICLVVQAPSETPKTIQNHFVCLIKMLSQHKKYP